MRRRTFYPDPAKPAPLQTPAQLRKLRAKLDRLVSKLTDHADRVADQVIEARAKSPRHALLISNRVVLRANRVWGDLESLGVVA